VEELDNATNSLARWSKLIDNPFVHRRHLAVKEISDQASFFSLSSFLSLYNLIMLLITARGFSIIFIIYFLSQILNISALRNGHHHFLCDIKAILYISLNEKLFLNGNEIEKNMTPLVLNKKTRNIKIKNHFRE
jgi:hypothetical protein